MKTTLKKTIIFLLSLFISQQVIAEKKMFFDKTVVERVLANAGNSKILIINIPICPVTEEASCKPFYWKSIFNCSNKNFYLLGPIDADILTEPNANDFFDKDIRFSESLDQFRSSCTQQPVNDRMHIFLGNNSSDQGYFLISDTLKKENGNLYAWIEMRHFENTIIPSYSEVRKEDRKDWMYKLTEKSNSRYSKTFHKINCHENKHALLSYFEYSSKGELIEKSENHERSFSLIVPGTVAEMIKEKLCAMY
ncbi:surface-adhesin E family protein [Limnobacter sp. P1]|uniref:surface-adhesin E family protein n=1 Tax=Limnobacter olei TaxID=3031298 RepID=UPI0023B175C2|nr:surface-adhesin E family protein [Limnobacter sp. P1]